VTTWREQQVEIPTSRVWLSLSLSCPACDAAACPVPGILRCEHPEQETRMADTGLSTSYSPGASRHGIGGIVDIEPLHEAFT
jgi:hypothetical protein